MIEIGKFNDLRIVAKNSDGLSLSDGDREILLPYSDVPKNAELGDTLKVFAFVNKDGNTIATTQTALAEIESFACLTVVDSSEDGAYLDLGIGKDIYVPVREQKRPMHKGESYVVYVYLDENNQRMLASSRLDKFIDEEYFDFDEGDEVSLLICDKTDLGFNAIINNRNIGLLYHNELFANLQPGEKRKGWIKKIRIEGKIDLSLQPLGYSHILDTKDVILKELKENGGKIALGDKSTPDEIYDRFQISKSAFKKATGGLYKERIISISDYEIKIVIDQLAD
ncbi:RNA-binding protein [Pedobacter frigiditerrae]|uniref:RNA-binding protein n=1 Tax=Pedobacter frigiditerrae TaxID=2530452 RepID=A0A4V2MI76_9SPHI|nr:S1-like domain-containing RNA-binding protein [Pedobacter frigiditerrae]TCC89286.1 RNA-binding protein [Pedobacter frigiditerrae]